MAPFFLLGQVLSGIVFPAGAVRTADLDLAELNKVPARIVFLLEQFEQQATNNALSVCNQEDPRSIFPSQYCDSGAGSEKQRSVRVQSGRPAVDFPEPALRLGSWLGETMISPCAIRNTRGRFLRFRIGIRKPAHVEPSWSSIKSDLTVK